MLSDLIIFKNLSEAELNDIKSCTNTRTKHYDKHSILFHAGDIVNELCFIIKGSVNIENIDVWGNETIISNVPKGHVFAETYALSGEPMMVDVIAAEPCDIFFLKLDFINNETNISKSWRSKVLKNLLTICVKKNLTLSTRIFCTSAKTIRERVFTYLSAQAVINNSTTFQIPFNRQQMANYLNVERSALSNELGKMRDEGLIIFHKNEFTLINPQA